MLTAKRLRELLKYDAATGNFRWRVDRRGTARAGGIAGTVIDGRRRIRIDGEKHSATRLAFLYVLGRWPKGTVTHLAGDDANDAWRNLRDGNHRRPPRDGVRAIISSNGRRRSVTGLTLQEAVQALTG